ncbi:MAG: hypothetical protein FJW23_02070 [Acidimicrobiia bacterium]|nr:hypothetical protein [Acidimicrobiia bacterium]
MSLHIEEFRALRATIAHRGTARILLGPATLAAWAALLLAAGATTDQPLLHLGPLLVLTAGFEAVRALHAGVERIGRYLQVFFEETTDGAASPRWETTVMQIGPTLPGGNPDPLFSLPFGAAAIVGGLAATLQGTGAADAVLLPALHAIFLLHLVRTRRAIGRQRQQDLEHYRQLR